MREDCCSGRAPYSDLTQKSFPWLESAQGLGCLSAELLLCRCLANGGASEGGKKGPQRVNGASAASNSAKPKLAVPPKLLLAIEKDKALRDRLKKYHLSTKGTRKVTVLPWHQSRASCNFTQYFY